MWNFIYSYIVNVACTLFFLFFIRIYIVYKRIHNPKKIISRAKSWSVKLMVVLGSGGHTFEMLHLLKHIGPKFKPIVYIVTETDILSEKKVTSCKLEPLLDRTIEKIPRSREVGQSWFSTVFTTLFSFFKSFFIVFKHKPDAIVCNGPGTCVPICVSAFLFHIIGLKHITVIYIESICRVRTMSLSGKILYHISDQFLVQWPQLKEKYPRAKYLGRLI